MVFQAKTPETLKKKKKKRGLLERAARVTKLALSKIPGRRKKKKKKHKDVPQARPYAPPAAIPMGASPANGTPPAALPVAGVAPGALPSAVPVGAIQGAPLPQAVPVGGPGGATQLATLPFEPPRRRSRGRLQKLAFLMLFFLVAGGLVGLITWVAQNPDELAKNNLSLGHTLDGVTGTSKMPPDTGSLLIRPTDSRPPIPKETSGQPPIVRNTGAAPTGTRPPILRDTGSGPRPTGSSIIPPPPTTSNFPRRMLAVIPANYAFATPIGYGGNGPRSLTTVVQQLGDLLRISQDQITLLSDRAPVPMPPIKDIIQTNVANYLSSCRPQDRIVFLFVGHGVEVADKPYLVPLEGEVDNAENLIPLDWVFDQLKKCPARQKIFIVDVCRFDPLRGEERGAVAKMGANFDALLKNPPAGIQVLTACSANEYSYEVPANSGGGSEFEGGVMLSQIPALKLSGGLKGVIQQPEDPIPIQALATTLGARTGAFARTLLKSQQTVRLTGTEAESAVVYDPKAPAAPKFNLKLTGIFEKGGVANRADIEAMFKLVAGIPPVKRTDTPNTLTFDSMPPYPADKVAPYKDDGGNSPLREKVREAVDLLKQNNQQFQELFLRNFNPDNQQQSTNFKNQISQIQMNAGLIQFKLDTVLEELDAMQPDRAKEPKLWQANYDYVRARLAAKIAYVYEYNAKLGEMRKEYPAMDPMIHKGWQLVAKGKISDRDADKYAKRARQYLEQLAKDTAGSPWELFAKREKITALGLDWQPSPK
jgi:hypothetical protein